MGSTPFLDFHHRRPRDGKKQQSTETLTARPALCGLFYWSEA